MPDSSTHEPATERRWWRRNQATLLTCALAIHLALTMASDELPAYADTLGQCLLATVLALTILTAVRRTGSRVLGVVLAVPFAVLTLIQSYARNADIALAADCCGALLLASTVALLISQILRTRTVTHDTIAAGLAGYLLLAATWTKLFAAVYRVDPQSFHLPSNVVATITGQGQTLTDQVFFYYSVVTLTTLGYGDMYPLTAPARALAAMEAIVGQIYLTVLVAALVGMGISRRRGA